MNIYIVKKENSNDVVMEDYVLAERIGTQPYSNLIEFFVGEEVVKIVKSTSVSKLEEERVSWLMEKLGAKNQDDLFKSLKQTVYSHFA